MTQQTKNPLDFKSCFENTQDFQGFPGGTVDENLPASAGDMSSIPGPGSFHMPWST